jgi:branched-chain amino acid transport system ATP-binding protein
MSAAAASAPAAPEPVLAAYGLSKVFRNFLAVNNVDFSVREGSIHALIGPNGAGKTTVFNLLTRFLEPTRGRVVFQGVDITRVTPAAVARSGLVRSFQISATFASLSVLENVRVALQRRAGLATQFWRSDAVLATLDERAHALIDAVNLGAYAHAPAGSLSYGRKRVLELAATLALEPRILLLDEPMAGMAHEDIDRVVALIREAAVGRTVLMVEHNLSVVRDLCDTITVLQRGEVIAAGTYDEVSRDSRVREAYLGMEDG